MSEQHSAQSKRRRLGRGLQAIVAPHPGSSTTVQNTNHEASKAKPVVVEVAGAAKYPDLGGSHIASSGVVHSIRLDRIDPGKHQPRSRFDEEALASLAASIRAVGVIQPVVVRPGAGGRFELIAGERRVRAAGLAGLEEIPAIVRESDERSAAESALIENLQREDLNPIERGEGIRGLMDRFGLTQQEVASRVGLERTSVSNLVRLLELEGEIRALLVEGALGLGHGKVLLSMMPGAARIGYARRCARESWSVRRLESAVKSSLHRPVAVRQGGAVSAETADLEKRLGEHLGTRVRVRAGREGRGSLMIRFYNLDHFDDLMSRIGYRAED
jgi:ParB family chromosome partitioning protein